MKCLKNEKTGNIIRVDEKQAYQMAGNTWKYVSKDEWRKFNGTNNEVSHDMGGPVEKVVEEKKVKKSKVKK